MKGRLMFAAGVTTGFILGSRAGRQAYDQIKERVQTVAGSPRVQDAVDRAKEVAETRAPKATARVKQAAQAAAESATAAGETAKNVAAEASEAADATDGDTSPSEPSTNTKTASSTPTPAPTPTPVTELPAADTSITDESITPTTAV